MTATDAPALSELSEDQLASLYDAVSYDQEAARIVRAEQARRKRNAKAREDALQARRRDPVAADWSDAALAQFRQAEAECQGNLVRRGIEITDPFSLWAGPEWLARARATEELCNFWDTHPRIPTVTEWREHERGDIPPDPTEGEDMDTTEAGAYVAPEATAPPQDRQARLNARVAELRAQGQQRAARMNPHAAVAVPEPATVAPQGSDRAALIAAETIRYAERVLTRHVSWPSQTAVDTVLLWLFHANARDRDESGLGPLIWRASPRLLLTSKDRGSGKSTGLDLIAILTGSRFGRLPRITAPGFAKLMGKFQEPAIIDEAKMVFGTGQKSLDLQGMMLAGYTPRTSSLTAHAGGTGEALFGVVAYAGKDNLITAGGDSIGDLLDRSLIIRLTRPSRHYPDIDEAAERAGQLACEGMATWTSMMHAELVAASRRLSREASEAGELDAGDVEAGALRSAQIWRPLIAVADVLGGDWPERARAACEAGGDETDTWLAGLRDLDSALFAEPEADEALALPSLNELNEEE